MMHLIVNVTLLCDEGDDVPIGFQTVLSGALSGSVDSADWETNMHISKGDPAAVMAALVQVDRLILAALHDLGLATSAADQRVRPN